MITKGIKIRKFGSSFILEFTNFQVEPFTTLRSYLDRFKKLPAYIEAKEDGITIHLPQVVDGKVLVKVTDKATSVWKVDEYDRYYITIPKDIGERFKNGAVMEMFPEENKVRLTEGIVMRVKKS